MVLYDDKLMFMPEQLTLASSVCRLAGEVLPIRRRVMQESVGITRAEESESRPELESVGVDRFGWSRSWSWSR